jgi:hypothetical protein
MQESLGFMLTQAGATVAPALAALASAAAAQAGDLEVLPALLRGLLASGVVALLLVALRRGGPRLAGLLAALPVTSAPTLFWIGHDLGPPSAAAVATASLYVTGLTALLALVYGLLGYRLGAARGGALALLLTAACAYATSSLGAALPLAAGFTAAALLLALGGLPQRHGDAVPAAGRRDQIVLTLVVTAVLTTLILLLAPRLPLRWCGLLAALPVIGMVTIVRVQQQIAPAACAAFLRAYVSGLIAKAAFLLTLAATLVPLGLAGAWALALGAALGVVVLARAARPRGATPALLKPAVLPRQPRAAP